MSEDTSRRCKTCGKRLLDEKVPICSRCLMKGRNTAGKVAGIIVGGGLTTLGIVSRVTHGHGSGSGNSI